MPKRTGTTRFTEAKLSRIHPPSAESILAICRRHRFTLKTPEEVGRSIGLTASAAEAMRAAFKKHEKPSAQVKRLRKLAKQLLDAAKWLGQFDPLLPTRSYDWEIVEPPALGALSEAVGPNLRDVLTGAFVAQASHYRKQPSSKAIHDPEFVLSALKANPGGILQALMLNVARSLAIAANSVEKDSAAGGPKPHRIVRMLLVNLADCYSAAAGKRPTPEGDFAKFAQSVFNSIWLAAGSVDSQLS